MLSCKTYTVTDMLTFLGYLALILFLSVQWYASTVHAVFICLCLPHTYIHINLYITKIVK